MASVELNEKLFELAIERLYSVTVGIKNSQSVSIQPLELAANLLSAYENGCCTFTHYEDVISNELDSLEYELTDEMYADNAYTIINENVIDIIANDKLKVIANVFEKITGELADSDNEQYSSSLDIVDIALELIRLHASRFSATYSLNTMLEHCKRTVIL